MAQVSYDAFADVYDTLMADVDYDAWADYLQEFLQQAPRRVRRVTEAGCGTGSISLRLAAHGYEVTATDLSPEMLAVGAERAREAGVHIRFARQDVGALELGRCDALVCACDVLNYLPPERLPAVFSRAFAGLARGGVLLFDLSSPSKLRGTLAGQVYYEDREDLSYFWRNTWADDPPRVEMDLTFFLRRGNLYERRDERQAQYVHETAEVLRLLSAAGFSAAAYAFGTHLPPGEETDRIFFAAYKPAEAPNF